METNKETFYLIRADVLPESFQKTLQVKRMLTQGQAQTIQEAVEKVGLSRSVYYKYKDAVFPFNTLMRQKIITVSLNLEHKSGVLSTVLSYVATRGGNVITINQTIPLQGVANVVLSIETTQMKDAATELVQGLQAIDGVCKAAIVGQE